MKHAFLRASFLACSAILAFGQSLPSVSFQATAQTIAGSRLYLTGNVHIGNAKCSIEADEVDYNVTTGEVPLPAVVDLTFPVAGATINL